MYEISRAEIEAEMVRFSTTYDLIRVLRPGMLVTRDVIRESRSPVTIPQAGRGMRVYLDGVPHGGVETLTMIPASSVASVRWLSGVDATIRYGTGNAAGAIVVTTRNARP